MYVYRRPFDHRRQPPPWLLLSPKPTIVAFEATMSMSGQTAAVNYSDTTAYVYRDLPPLVPVISQGVYRQSYTVRRARPPIVIPRAISSGSVEANRAELTFAGQPATIQFDEINRFWLLNEAIRSALVRRRLAYREPLDMRPWSDRVVQFTIPTQSLTAYTREMTISGQLGTVQLSRGVGAQLAQLAIARPTAAVRLGKSIAAQAALLTLTPQTSRIGTGRTVQSVTQDLAVTGQQAASRLSRAVTATSQSLVIASMAASFGQHLHVAAQVHVMAITPQGASAEIEKAVAAFAAALTLTTHGAAAGLPLAINAGSQALQIDVGSAGVQFARQVQAAFAELSIQDRTALIEGTQSVIVQVGQRTIRVRGRNRNIVIH